MAIRCITRFGFCCGHRLRNHEGKCKHLHGHNWEVEVELEAETDELDSCGRVVDFGVVRAKLKGWVDEHLDHGMVLDDSDAAAIGAVVAVNGKLYTMKGPPSAENIASLLFGVATNQLDAFRARVVSVSVAESAGGRAVCTG